MIKIKKRIEKLEQRLPDDNKIIRIHRFIVMHGDLDPVGYEFNGIQILRQPSESTEELRKRCSESVPEDGRKRVIFHSISN